jgi:long-chain acyl-CoA synthetase
MPTVRDVGAAPDPVSAVLDAHERGELIALRTSGTVSRPRAVVRTTGSWVDSFPHVSRLTDVHETSRVWVPGPLSATMNLFAVVHARFAGAAVVDSADDATHAHLTPALLRTALQQRTALAGVHVVVAGDRLPRDLADRARATGTQVSHYYGAAELSFVAWGSADDLRPFPGVELRIRDDVIWVRSPYLSLGYLGSDGPFTLGSDGFASVGDRGRLSDGVLTVTGRGVAAVVTGGSTVLVDDVEQALSSASGAEVVVVGVAHPRLGQVVAAVVTDRAALTAARAAAHELDPAQRPRLWFSLPRWPVTAAGKVDRVAVAELAGSGGLTPVPLNAGPVDP